MNLPFRWHLFSAARRFRISTGLFALALWLVFVTQAGAVGRLSALAPKPDWSDLEPFQKTITHDDFLNLLNSVYAPDGVWNQTITVTPDAAVVHPPDSSDAEFRLEFASAAASVRPLPVYWKGVGAHPTLPGKPLAGLTIALDPGHLGGKWAIMEERWFKIGDSKPVTEGDMTLTVARLLASRLANQGAKVVFVRNAAQPLTRQRPGDLRGAALAELLREGITKPRDTYQGAGDPLKFNSISWMSELLFYRNSEIRRRAQRVNNELKPDLTLCLHFNAEDWGDPAKPTLTDTNHLHLLVNGNYSAGELSFEDYRHDMLAKLLNRTAGEELALSSSVAASLAGATGLPPFEYHGTTARRVSGSPYVWMRNLLANRLYRCPVVYTEPYVMNSKPVFDRVQLGDYDGFKPVEGVPRKSIYREYADAVAAGLVNYFSAARPPFPLHDSGYLETKIPKTAP